MRELENPYQSPAHVGSLGRVPRYPGTSRLRFLYVIGLVLSLSLVATTIVAPSFAMSFETTLLFFGATAAGPFSVLFHGNWILKPPELVVAILVFVATVGYLVNPNNLSLVISLLGAVAWVLVGAFLFALLA